MLYRDDFKSFMLHDMNKCTCILLCGKNIIAQQSKRWGESLYKYQQSSGWPSTKNLK